MHKLPFPRETGFMLDGHVHARSEAVDRKVPRVMFSARNFDGVPALAPEQGTVIAEPEDIGSVTVVYLDDPDDNWIRITVHKRRPEGCPRSSHVQRNGPLV